MIDFNDNDDLHDSEEGAARKRRSIDQLQSIGVPTIEHLPEVETLSEVEFRSPQEVAKRALLCIGVGACVNGIDPVVVKTFLDKSGAAEFASASERRVLDQAQLTQQEIVNASWSIEAAYPLLFSLGLFDVLPLPYESVDPNTLLDRTPRANEDPRPFVESARLIDKHRILDEVDLIFRIHWAARDANLNGRPDTIPFNYSVVMERHKALNWIVRYADEDDWDDIPTDT